ncbi:hypothetical protein [Sphingomonas quercus]|uniref:Uncharacterized protein n=1 Tax=Sphingomonas quercus TaxID=2842451 RepID=A0ABS6BKA4_9SPHN|nr:hypothetical protein [Sphingomonas quercus]MBU3078728.1 hypothetical protein [Sphingomonas quercus]
MTSSLIAAISAACACRPVAASALRGSLAPGLAAIAIAGPAVGAPTLAGADLYGGVWRRPRWMAAAGA